jgi:hypothetical protein
LSLSLVALVCATARPHTFLPLATNSTVQESLPASRAFGSALGQNKRLFVGRRDAKTANGGRAMVANSLFLTIAILLVLGFWLLGELKFFIPYKTVLFHKYGTAILVYLATLFLNLFAATFVFNRNFFLKDTGRKLSHLDKQLHMGQTEVRDPSLEEEVD